VRSFRLGVLVEVSRGSLGIDPAQMGSLVARVASLGVDALFVRSTSAFAIEPVTLLAGLAMSNDLVLGAVVPLASGRNPAIVAKLATTLAMLAPGRSALIFEADDDDGRLLESVLVASALMSDGPVHAGGNTFAVRDAFNEPRSGREDLPAVGAIVSEASASLIEASDIILERSAAGETPSSGLHQVIRVVDEQTEALGMKMPIVVEISGCEVDHVVEVAARIAARLD
jgi:alkanesulfonate monooxygenase SsuD/methylene tetrahydromethanopterin reductase-like flavin-dependent oxidoreductase (luciferase family)